jgi:BolA protein
MAQNGGENLMSVEAVIRQKLAEQLSPTHLEVINESHMHSVPPGSESHFKVVIVSDDFSGKRRVGRHQAVYAVLSEELAGGVHALALHTYTEQEWAGHNQQAPQSPACHGGSKADAP